MPLRISGKNIDIGEALRERINARLAEACDKYFDGGGYSGHVTVAKEAFGFRTDSVLHLDSGVVLEANGMAADAYASADQAAERLGKRLRRYGRRLKDRSAARRENGRGNVLPAEAIELAPSYVIAAPDDDSETEANDFNPVIVAESTTTLRRMPVSDAVQELDITGAAVVVFRHAGHGGINVVYRRNDGNVGWIDPPVSG